MFLDHMSTMASPPTYLRKQLADCFSKGKAQSMIGSSLGCLIEYLKTDQGVKELKELRTHAKYGPILVFLCAGMKRNPVFSTAPSRITDAASLNRLLEKSLPADLGRNRLQPTAKSVERLVDWATLGVGIPSFYEYIVRRCMTGASAGWLRHESTEIALPPGVAFDRNVKLEDNDRRRLSPCERGLLRLHICLLIGETVGFTELLAHAWGLKERSICNERQQLRNLLRGTARRRKKAVRVRLSIVAIACLQMEEGKAQPREWFQVGRTNGELYSHQGVSRFSDRLKLIATIQNQ